MSSGSEDGEDLYCDIPVLRHHPFYNTTSNQNQQTDQSSSSSSSSESTSKTTSSTFNESQSVAEHYNARPNVQPQARGRSEIIHLRDFNNWTKSVLIREFVSQRKLSVLDLACGKGGDLFKWDKASVQHVTGIGK